MPLQVVQQQKVKNGLKKGDILLPLLFNFSLEYAIRRIQVNQNDMKLNGRYWFLLMILIYWAEAYKQ